MRWRTERGLRRWSVSGLQPAAHARAWDRHGLRTATYFPVWAPAWLGRCSWPQAAPQPSWSLVEPAHHWVRLGGEGTKLKGLRGHVDRQGSNRTLAHPRALRKARGKALSRFCTKSKTEHTPRKRATEAKPCLQSHCQGKGTVGRPWASAPTTFAQEITSETHEGRDSTQEIIHTNIGFDFLPHPHPQADLQSSAFTKL